MANLYLDSNSSHSDGQDINNMMSECISANLATSMPAALTPTELPSPCDSSQSFESHASYSSTETNSGSMSRRLAGHPHFPSRIASIEVLRPEEIRWMFREREHKKWIPFIGYDSLRIECKYRELQQSKCTGVAASIRCDEFINVKGGLYEVDVSQMKCMPIYWNSPGVYFKRMFKKNMELSRF